MKAEAMGVPMPATDDDHEAIMDQVAMEAMHAVDSKDHEKYRDALHVLVGDLLSKMQTPEKGES